MSTASMRVGELIYQIPLPNDQEGHQVAWFIEFGVVVAYVDDEPVPVTFRPVVEGLDP